MPTVSFHTLGCKLNQAETAALAEQFTVRGYTVVPWGERADVSVLNTCTVTSRSDAKCRQAVSYALNLHPATTVVVTGCYSQVAARTLASLPGVDFVFGTYDKFRLFDVFPGPGKQPRAVVVVSVNPDAKASEGQPAGILPSHTRAFLRIQSGCNRRCAYCIVPLARGPSRSLPAEGIMEAADRLVENGCKEIVLTGTHIGDFGKDRNGQPGLPGLLLHLAGLHPDVRIRLSSLDPEDLGTPLLDAVASAPNACRHFHISLQSGSDAVLKAMHRSTTSGSIRNVVNRIASRLGKVGLGADVIVGFPGETDARFEETVRFIQALPFTYLHVFPFSPRSGTAAASMPDLLPSRLRNERAEHLRKVGFRKKNEFQELWIGSEVEVLIESRIDRGTMSGFSSEYVRVHVPADVRLVNTLARVRVEERTDRGVFGSVITSEVA